MLALLFSTKGTDEMLRARLIPFSMSVRSKVLEMSPEKLLWAFDGL